MLPTPIEHVFTLQNEPYRLVEWDRGGERRIRAEYAIAIAPAPATMETMDGASLYVEAVARECLKEAPEVFWETLPAAAAHNGAPRRVPSFEHVPRALWEDFRREVDQFLGKIFPALPATPESESAAGPGESVAVAAVAPVSPMLRGRAE
jgi:hypothetical protein